VNKSVIKELLDSFNTYLAEVAYLGCFYFIIFCSE